jgi:hypothetical protein
MRKEAIAPCTDFSFLYGIPRHKGSDTPPAFAKFL